MNVLTKNWFRISILCVFTGFIMILVAYCMDNTLYNNWQNFHVSIIGDETSIFGSLFNEKNEGKNVSVKKNMNGNDNSSPNNDIANTGHSSKVKESNDVNAKQLRDIKSISLNISYGSVRIKKGEKFDIDLKDDSYKITEKIENEVWEITDTAIDSADDNSTFLIFGHKITINDKPNKGNEIIVTIPKDYIFENVDIILGAGSLQADQLMAENVSVYVGAGRLKIKSLTASQKSSYTVDAGEIDIKDLNANNATIDCGLGRMDATGIIKGDSKVICGVGKVELELNGDEKDYNYIIDCDIGTVKINGKKYHGFSSLSQIDNNADNNFTLDCGVGKISLKIR